MRWLVLSHKHKLQSKALRDVPPEDGSQIEETLQQQSCSGTFLVFKVRVMMNGAFWKMLQCEGIDLEAMMFWMDSHAFPSVTVALLKAEFLSLAAKGSVVVDGKERFSGVLQLDFNDPKHVIRATLQASLQYQPEEQHLKASLELDGTNGNAIKLGHWVPILDWIEFYGIEGTGSSRTCSVCEGTERPRKRKVALPCLLFCIKRATAECMWVMQDDSDVICS